ncbi:MAG: DUF5979 domain-containing protein [Lachnospiraceae bacterium]|nr:DUF5979 domain-containing protein [Lachnospiraceae bacterium]
MKKRILTWLLAVVMMVSFSTTALADTGDEDPEESAVAYSDQSSITITKYFGDGYYGYSQAEVCYLVQTGKSGVDESDSALVTADVPDLDVPDTLTDQYKQLTLDGRNSEDYNLESDNVADTLYPVVGTATYTAGSASSLLGISDEDGEGTFTITLPQYTQPGTYTYTLREVTGKTLGVTYYSGEITLVVKVYYNPSYDENDPESDKFIRIVYVNAESEDEDIVIDGETGDEGTDVGEEAEGSGDGDSGAEPDASSTEKINYINNYSETGSLTITKNVTGNMGDRSGDTSFEITVEFTVPEGYYWDGTALITRTDKNTGELNLGDGLRVESESNYIDPTDPEDDRRGIIYSLYNGESDFGELRRLNTKETSSEGYYAADTKTRYYTTYYYTFSLAHGESLTLWNLPYGVSYRVYESDSQGYTASYTLSTEDQDNWTRELEKFTIVQKDEDYPYGYLDGGIDLIDENTGEQTDDHDELIIYNEKPGDVNTGLSLDSLPYILILAAVGACAVVLISRKRMIGEN